MQSRTILEKTCYKYNVKHPLLLLGISLYACVYSLRIQWQIITNPNVICEDVRQHIWVYLSSWDPSLFPNDIISDFFCNAASFGEKWFYYVIGLFFNPLVIIKYLPVLFSVISVIYIYKLGKYLSDNITGACAGIIFLFSSYGGARFFGVCNGTDFGNCLTIIFLFYLAVKKYTAAGILSFIVSLFYPPLSLVCLSIYFFQLLHDLIKSKKLNKYGLTAFCIAVLCTGAFLIYKTSGAANPIRNLSLSEMKTMPEFYIRGNHPIFFSSFYEQINNEESGLALDKTLYVLVIVSLVMALFFQKRAFELPYIYYCLLGSGAGFFIAAHMFFFKLFMPSRYMRLSLPLFLVFFLAWNARRIIKFAEERVLLRKILPVGLIVFLIWGFFIPGGQDNHLSTHPKVFSFLKTLPNDSMIAGHPAIMDDAPVFTLKKIFVTKEISVPYYGIYPILKKRTYEFFNIYYAKELNEIYNMCVTNQITHLVVCKKHFEDAYLEKGDIYYEPVNSVVLRQIAGKNDFALFRVPDTMKIYEDDDVFVIKVDDIKKCNAV